MLTIGYKNKKGQVAPFFVMVMAVLLLAIAATMVVGEVAFNRVRLANVADGALISAASGLCRSLNYIKQLSFGPNGLLIHYVSLQTYLGTRGFKGTDCYGCDNYLPCTWDYKAQPLASGYFIMSMLESKRLYEEAEHTADAAAKDLPIKLYDLAFGGGLIDEPKPVIDQLGNNADNPESPDEINRDAKDKPIKLAADKYLNRPTRFTLNYRAFRKAAPGAWYRNEMLFYSFNKSRDKVIRNLNSDGTPIVDPNTIKAAEPAPVRSNYCGDDESCLRVKLSNVPTSISVSPQMMVMFYMWGKAVETTYGCICVPIPAFIPHPYAWINKINLDSSSFGISLKTGSSFAGLPFFGSKPKERGKPCDPKNDPDSCQFLRPTLEQRSRVKIQGSVWRGYDPKFIKAE
jgi:hypothetical protein